MAAVIADVGTVNTRMGRAGEGKPTSLFPSVVAELRAENNAMAGAKKEGVYVGDDVRKIRALVQPRCPFEGGHLDLGSETVREDWLRLLRHGAAQLQAPLTKLVCVEPTNVTRRQREQIAKTLLESKEVEELWIVSPPPLALFASGRTTGCAVEVGESGTTVTPVIEGHAVDRRKWGRSDQGGLTATNELIRLLRENGRIKAGELLRPSVLHEIKKDHCYCSTNQRDDEHLAENDPESLVRIYELPDGRQLQLGEERFRTSEVLFSSAAQLHSGQRLRSVQKMVTKAVGGCSEGLQAQFLSNIVPYGGAALTQFFRERLQKELQKWLDEEGLAVKKGTKLVKPRVAAAEGCSQPGPSVCFQAWRGASLLSKLSSFDVLKITAKDVEENGAAVVHRKQMIPAGEDGG